MIDSLVQFLLEEIAMDGDAGTSVEALADFIKQFYSRAATSTDSPAPPPLASTSSTAASKSTAARTQKIDDAFVTFVWNALIDLPDVRVGVLSKIEKPADAAADAPQQENGKPSAAQDEDALMAGTPGADDAVAAGMDEPAKGKRKKIERKAQGPTHEMRILPAEERGLGRDALTAKYGDQLRVLSGEETTWVAITGSHLRPSSLTPVIYSVLQMISRGREEGTTAVRISKELGIDPKSVFHYLKVPQQLGIIKKFRDTDGGCWTNRALHVRYLATSPFWAVHVKTEPDAVKEEEGGGEDGAGGGGGEEEAGAGGQWGGDEMSPISPLYLTTNHEVIRKRVVKALKRRKDWWMPHFDLHTAIGLHAAEGQSLRRLNAIVTTMAEEGILEKITVTKKKSGGVQSRTQALRLRRQDELQVDGGGENAEVDVKVRQRALHEAAGDEDDDDGSSYPVTMRTIEQQILDLVMNAGSRGITNVEISAALGNFSMRFIESILQRLGRFSLPAHLGDYTLFSLQETVGRLKRVRWFSLVGYLSYRRARGFPDEAQEERWQAIVDQGRLGQWDEEAADGPREGQYGTALERQKRLNKFNMWQHAADSQATVGNRRKKSAVNGKGKGKAKATTEGGGAADAAEAGDGSDLEPPPPPPKKVQGRPRKNPLKEGEESPYMRRKREKAEDEERARQGLPPLVRVRGKAAKKKKAAETEAEGGDEAGQPEASTSGAKTKKKQKDSTAKKGSKKAASTPADTEAAEIEVDELEDNAPSAPAASPPVKKKRGRPPRNKTAETGTPAAAATEPVAEVHEVGDNTPSAPDAPPPVKKKRGRPPKKKTAETGTPAAAATEVVAAEAPPNGGADGGPSADVDMHPSSTATGPESDAAERSTTSAAPSTRKRTVLTMEPFIEIDVSSPPKRSKTSATPRSASNAAPAVSTAPAGSPSETPATPSAPVAGPSGTQGGRLEKVALPPPTPGSTTPIAASTPAAASSPTQVAAPLREATPGGKALRGSSPTESKPKKKSSRASVSSKLNLTQLARQQEVLDYVAASGGMIEQTHRLNELIHAWSSSQTPPVSVYMMDKHRLNEALKAALRGGRLKRTVVTGAKGERYEVYYLPTIDLASDEARRFLMGLSEADRPNRFHIYRAVTQVSSDMSDDEDADEPKDVIGNAKKRLHEEQALDDPEPAQGKAVVQEYFRQQQAVLGRVHGVKYGLVARARQLHKWLASYVFRHGDEPDSGISRDNGDLVIAQDVMLDRMPLGVFRRIVPLPVESEQLDAYLAEEANQHNAMRDLPAEIASIVRPRLGKRKAAMWRNLELLMDLSVLSPAVWSINDRGGGSFSKPRKAKWASHWRFHVRVPVYSFADAQAPLVAVHTVDSNQSVAAFWTTLQSVSTAKYRDPLPGTQAEGFPSVYSGRNLSRRELVSAARWRDTYQLVPTQRSFLCKLATADPGILDQARAAELAEWARCLYAPADVVARYLSDVLEGRNARGKRRRVRKLVVGADGVETEVLVSEDEEARESATAILARKRKEAAAQQEQDWNGILERFRRDHGNPALDQITVDWLHVKFIDPRPSNKLDAKQLDFELRRLLPSEHEAHPGPGEGRQTLVPLAVQRKARRAQDPYAVTREPNFRKRVSRPGKPKVPRVRTGQPTKVYAPRQRERSPFVPLPNDDPDAPFQPADQRAFLENPLPPYPKLGPGKRIPRSHFATEHDELLLDAEIVLQVRAQALNLRVQFGALDWFFPGHPRDVLSKRVRTLLKRPADKDMHDRVLNAFVEVYNTYKGSVRDPYPLSLVNFDLAAWIRILREKVNRRQLRLMAVPDVNRTEKPVDLPGSLGELRQYYRVKPAEGSTSLEGRWDKVWTKYPVAAASRDDAVASVPYAQTWEDKAPTTPESREEELALGALKTVLSTPDETYREEEGDAMLRPFEAHIDKLVEDLREKGLIVKAERDEARRIPGRNFAFTDKYLNRFGARIDLSHLQEASLYEQDLMASAEGVFPLAPMSGEMMAFFDLLSEGKASLSIDTSTLTDKALDVRDYTTRQANDDDIECTVNIVPASPSQARSGSSGAILPEPLLEVSKLSVDGVDAATSAVLAENTLASSLLTTIGAAGKDGIPYDQLLKRFERTTNADSCTFVDAVSRLTTASPPMVFFGGVTRISLVSISYLAEWTVPVAKSDSADTAAEQVPEKRFLPTIWTTVRGEVNPELYQRAAGWVKGELKFRSGVTAAHLVDRAVGAHLLSAYEVRTLLLTLLKAGQVACRDDPTDAEVDAAGKTALCTDGDRINWARAHWFADGVFW